MVWNKPGNGNSGNRDPWGPKRGGQQGPPDLDEIVRNVQNKLSGLFGGGRGGGRGRGVGFKGGGIGFGVIVVVVLALWLLSGFYVVQQAERGVVLRFGKLQEVTEAGLRWHLPFPIEGVEKVDVQNVFQQEVGYRSNERTGRASHVPAEALMLTEDENIVDIEFAVQYQISNAANYLFNVQNPEETIAQVTESAIREIVGKSTLDHVITEGRVDVADKTQALLQEILERYKTGIVVTTVKMQKAQPPEQVKAAFDDAVKAREDEQRFKNEAQAYSNDILPRARGNAARLVQEGEGYKASVIARSEGDAQRFSKIAREYEKAPAITRERLYLESVEAVLSNSTTVLIDQKGGNNILYLPLDKIVSQGRSGLGDNGPSSAGADSGVGSQPFGRGRTRNDLRTRGTE
ncbi:MAG: FtsH protease activity modulator HflK [Gammaproteobacteria bacterium]|nr:FtsH protease activity modulator HflK [Gammaproteobacteria bacterium]